MHIGRQRRFVPLVLIVMFLFLIWGAQPGSLSKERETTHSAPPLNTAPSTKTDYSSPRKDVSSPRKYAIFLQLGTNAHLFPELLKCASNTAEAMKGANSLDIYVATLQANIDSTYQYREALETLPDVGQIHISVTENQGADIGQFMEQLKLATENSNNYRAILKVHAKSDAKWRKRMLESLCGTPNQVRSILSGMDSNQAVKLVAPLGTSFGPLTPVDQIFPRIKEVYAMTSCGAAFDPSTVIRMRKLHGLLTNAYSPTINLTQHLAIVAGSSFWIKWDALNPATWMRNLEEIKKGFTKGYVRNGGMEHIIERLIPTMVQLNGGSIYEITPAPRVFAMYFPQYHAFPENDRFWGKGFTEWTLLKPLNITPPVRKPLSVEDGGLGYYNLLDKEPRRRQAEIARDYGVEGFVYYHYWFSGIRAPVNHTIMTGVPEAMLRDGEPNLPFFFSWANEPWNRRWTGQDVEPDQGLLLSQDYGDESEWREHFEYLLKFFRHPNYVKKDGCPVFAFYRPGHVKEKFAPMLELWRKLAIGAGFSGMWIIQTVGGFYNGDSTSNYAKAAHVDGSFHFWPMVRSVDDSLWGQYASFNDLEIGMGKYHTQYWGADTDFDRRPRGGGDPGTSTPDIFGDMIGKSFKYMSSYSNRVIDVNLFFITAWNEWNEQALLEPDDIWGFGFIKALRQKLQSVPLQLKNFK